MSTAKQRSKFLQPQPRPQASAAVLLMPSATVFVGSLCIMVLELTAGRLMAAFLGYSLYTWTSVIGVVLAGIAAGNFFGGRLADRYTPRAILIIVFGMAALACGIIPPLNRLLGDAMLLLAISWPLKVMLHVTALLLLPSILLGMVSPVVATWALQQGLRTGRTVGDIFAWSAVGSIVGTFLTGFLLIPVLGTAAIMLAVAGVLAALSLLFVVQDREQAPLALLLTAVISLLAFVLYRVVPLAPAQTIDQAGGEVLFKRESQYSHIRVITDANAPHMRVLMLDQLAHSRVDMRNPANLDGLQQYSYVKFYGLFTDMLGTEKETLRTLSLGGGGYVIPQYVAANWPGSHVEVAEIDPAVTETAMEYLGLPRDHGMAIVHLDVRNHIDDLLRRQQLGEDLGQYDLIYGDAFNDFTVPFQLTTVEFHQKLRTLMAPAGVYLLNVVDVFSSGRFLGAELATLRSVFPWVYVFAPGSALGSRADQRDTFVFVCALQPLNDALMEFSDTPYRRLSDAEVEELATRAGSIILTDNYAPVENLLAAVTRAGGALGDRERLAGKLLDRAGALAQAGRLDAALAQYRKVIALDAPRPDLAHNNIAALLARQQKFDEAVQEFRAAIAQNPGLIPAHMGLARALLVLGRVTQAADSFQVALERQPDLVANPSYVELARSIMEREQRLRRLQQR
ncbi:MAG: fused MFS/spermidine synthase [Proteobacteria bacterium]|nr:fused MFS/spermidine synthase [Pseudomonadota bacterium]